jgi:hypothetical protein
MKMNSLVVIPYSPQSERFPERAARLLFGSAVAPRSQGPSQGGGKENVNVAQTVADAPVFRSPEGTAHRAEMPWAE